MENLNYAPILIPTLNRYEHLRRCVESLAKNKLAKESELVIGLDYPPQEKYQEGWEKIKEFLPTISGFGKVTILSADKNIGAVNNGIPPKVMTVDGIHLSPFAYNMWYDLLKTEICNDIGIVL